MMSELRLTLIETNENYQILDIFLSGDGIIHPEILKELVLPAEADYEKGVVIFGRAPIWLYSYLAHKCHPFAFVAVFDPRLGGIVLERHVTSSPEIGYLIAANKINDYINKHRNQQKKNKINGIKPYKVIAFIGPPHSGKTILLDLIRKQLIKYVEDQFYQRDFYIVRACPDGEGNWTNEIEPDYIQTLRYKNTFDDVFVDKIIKQLNKEFILSKKLIFVDCGGKIDNYNQRIWNLCTDAIIVSNTNDSIPEWRGAAKASNLNIIAEIHSSLNNIFDQRVENGVLKMKLGSLNNSMELEIPKILIQNIINRTAKRLNIQSL